MSSQTQQAVLSREEITNRFNARIQGVIDQLEMAQEDNSDDDMSGAISHIEIARTLLEDLWRVGFRS